MEFFIQMLPVILISSGMAYFVQWYFNHKQLVSDLEDLDKELPLPTAIMKSLERNLIRTLVNVNELINTGKIAEATKLLCETCSSGCGSKATFEYAFSAVTLARNVSSFKDRWDYVIMVFKIYKNLNGDGDQNTNLDIPDVSPKDLIKQCGINLKLVTR